MTTNNTISLCHQYVSFVHLNAENMSVLYVLVPVKTYVNVRYIEPHFT